MALEDTQVQSTPAVYVNGELIGTMPNTVKDTQPGETAVRAVSNGRGAVSHVAGVNAEALKGKVTFTLPNTARNQERIEDWRTLGNQALPSVISIQGAGRTRNYLEMYMTDAPELEYAAEGNLDVTFEGSMPVLA